MANESSIVIALFTDFGVQSVYIAQMEGVIRQLAPKASILKVVSDAPAFDPLRSGYLLDAVCRYLPLGTVIVGVVDPGVGTLQRQPVVLEAGGRAYVGPGNALFSVVSQRATDSRLSEILWKPESLSATFHGRDLFAPIAAHIGAGKLAPGMLQPTLNSLPAVPNELWEVIYIDSFGNAWTGIRAESLQTNQVLMIHGTPLKSARTYAEVAPAVPFWYVNSMGLIEIAASGVNVSQRLALKIGSEVQCI